MSQKKYMPIHTGCPYLDLDEHVCVRDGCLFMCPCLASKELVSKKHFKKRGK